MHSQDTGEPMIFLILKIFCCVMLYSLVCNIVYRQFENDHEIEIKDTDLASGEFWIAFLWPITGIFYIVFVWPREFVLKMDNRISARRERKAREAREKESASAYR